MSPEIERPQAPYAQVAAKIRERIVSGELGPGDRVPSVREVASTWGIARATAEKALNLLQSQGLITSRVGSGAVVSDNAPIYRSADDRHRQVARTGLIYTSGEHARILTAELEPAPEDVARALDVDLGEPVVRRHRVTYRGDEPQSSSTSWFTAAVAQVAPLLLERERIRQGTAHYVEECTGRALGADPRHEILARLATAAEADEFGLPLPLAVLETRHTAWDTAGQPLTYEVGLARPGHVMTINNRSENR
jgi:DNA-binding GntR family transcriptional regulator